MRMNKFTYLKALFSPFKPFKLKWYCGKIQIGTPYFYPRKWVKYTKEEAMEKAYAETAVKIAKHKEFLTAKQRERFFNVEVRRYMNTSYPVPKKIGFDFVGLGWKTKWTRDDYRFEWSPLISFVFFKWQIAVIVEAIEGPHYWESWLYYELSTDKTMSNKERIAQCRKEFPQTWTVSNGSTRKTVDYYPLMVKDKYL